MELLRKEIGLIAKGKPELQLSYYHDLLNVIDDHHETKPDISIESCKAIIEGISKLVLAKVEQTPLSEVDGFDLKDLVKKALNALYDEVEVFERDFTRSIINVVRIIGEVRNREGDISHGRASLKEQISDQDFSEMISRFTEALAIYILKKLDTVTLSENAYEADQMKNYNIWLDGNYPDFPIQTERYSKVLYQLDRDTYYQLYDDDYLPSLIIETELEKDAEEEQEEPFFLFPDDLKSRHFTSPSQLDLIKSFVRDNGLDGPKFIPMLDNSFFTSEIPSVLEIQGVMLAKDSDQGLKRKAREIESFLQGFISKLAQTKD